MTTVGLALQHKADTAVVFRVLVVHQAPKYLLTPVDSVVRQNVSDHEKTASWGYGCMAEALGRKVSLGGRSSGSLGRASMNER